jgi:hypothetical protein
MDIKMEIIKKFWTRSKITLMVSVAVAFLVFGLTDILAQKRIDRLIIGGTGSSTIVKVLSGSVAWNPAAVAANTSAENGVAIVATGASVGDFITITPASAFGAGVALGECRVSSLNVVSCVLQNSTGSSVDPSAQTVQWLAIRTRD